MHAGFPCFQRDIHKVMRLGARTGDMPDILEAAGGTLLATGMAVLLKLGFGFVLRDSLIDKTRSEQAMRFFDDNFVFTDPLSPTGKRYYQGKFLIRTKQPDDHMNVYLRFCPDPDDLFVDTPFGTSLNSLKVVSTDVLSENEADAIERDPDKVDLVIRFRNIESILGLIGREEVDIVGLLLENVVQLSGNVGHLFKLGSIAKEIELEVGLED
jgi:hypothetical protein